MKLGHHYLLRATPLLLLVIALSACSKRDQAPASAPSEASVQRAEGSVAADAGAMQAPAVAAEEKASDQPLTTQEAATQLVSSAATYTDAQRKFIRTARASFRVRDVYRSALTIEDVVAAQGGFVVSNEITSQIDNSQRRPKGDGKLIELAEYTVRGALVVRVPSERTQGFLRAIAGQIEFLDQRGFQAADAQFAMLRQALAYQRSQEAQLALAQVAQQGGKPDQKMAVIGARSEAQSARDEAQIAQKEFEDKVAFSTIELSMYQPSRIRQTELMDVEAVFEQNGPGFFARLGNALSVGWFAALDLLIGLMKLWPLWLLVIAVLAAYRRLTGKRDVPSPS